MTQSGGKKTFSILLCCLIAGASYAATCPPWRYDTNPLTAANAALKAAFESVQNAIDAALRTELKLQGDAIVSSLKVLTEQKALGADQVSTAVVEVNKNIATAYGGLLQYEREYTAMLDYSPEFGQGLDRCGTITLRQKISSDQDEVGSAVRDKVRSEIDAAPGRYADQVKSMSEQLAAYKENFCTSEQVAAGMCEREGKLPGAAVNAASLFKPALPGEILHSAKVLFINLLAGLPNPNIQKEQGKTPAAESYMSAKGAKDAVVSTAYAALKDVQVDTSGTESEESGGLPLSVMFEKEAKRYFGGGEEYTKWNKGLSAQRERGVLIEILQIKGLQMAIDARRHQQAEKQEALLAALVAQQVRRDETAKSAAQQAISEDMRSRIK